MYQDFVGKVALVTGAGTGIGAATALMLAARGARVALVGNVANDLEQRLEEIVSAGGAGICVAGNVAESGFADEMVARTLAAFGKLDVAANCAAISGGHIDFHALSDEEFRSVVSVNFEGIFFGMRAEIKAMLGSGGSIVNIGSANGHQTSLPRHAPYSAAKYGVTGLTRSAALDYATRGIRLNVVVPGSTDTPMTRAAGQLAIDHAKTVPMQRMAQPSEIAAPVCFLLSDLASYVTGSILVADGGYLMRS